MGGLQGLVSVFRFRVGQLFGPGGAGLFNPTGQMLHPLLDLLDPLPELC